VVKCQQSMKSICFKHYMRALNDMLTGTALHIKLESDHVYNREKCGNLINNPDIFWVTEWLKGRNKCLGNK
jgi:hypothetical protein